MTPSSILDLYRLRKQQWLKPEELEQIQLRKLKRIIKHAYENVPYYRKLFDSAGIRPGDIKSVGDLPKFPITTKSTLQSQPISEITATNVDLSKCISSRTSGTQGMPLSIYFRKEDKNFLDMVWARAKLENRQRLGDKVVTVREPTCSTTTESWFEHLGIWRKANVSSFYDVKNQLEILEKINPEVITGCPSSLKLLAMTLQEQRNKKIRPRLLFSTAELLDEDSREFIASSFGAPLFDCYGAHELGLIAWECSKKSGYHINIDSVAVEFVWNAKAVSPGERGKLICTALHSYAMPFIRYEIGDVGVKNDEKCPCGIGLPLMKIIEGRVVDFIILPDGKMSSPYLLTCAMEKTPSIARYQIVQKEKNSIVVLVIQGQGFTQHTITSIRRNLQEVLGRDVQIEVNIVDCLPPDKSGKFRVVLSKVYS